MCSNFELLAVAVKMFQLFASVNPTHELCRNLYSIQHFLEEVLVMEVELDFSTVFASAVWSLTHLFLEKMCQMCYFLSLTNTHNP